MASLARASQQNKKLAGLIAASNTNNVGLYKVAPSSDVEEGKKDEIKKQKSVVSSSYVPVPTKKQNVGYFTSLKSQLYLLCILLLSGLLFTMIITIVVLQSDGVSWMNDASTDLQYKQLQNLQAITDTKAIYVKVT